MNTDPKYSYEIDFLPVGDGKKSGDAIAMRWWRGEWSKERQKVMVIDGGTKESGEKLVEHIKKYYKTERVDHAINTHPDQDHASGLTEVLENLEVRELWMHRPWEHIEEIVKFVDRNSNFKGDKRATVDSIRDRFSWEYYQYAKELEKIALSEKISIQEPYEGKKIGQFCILSPNQSWHLFDLIPNSDKTKEFKPTKENPNSDRKTSRENESSVILYGNLGYGGILFTGDAGVEALERAYKYAKKQGINIAKNLKFIQVPHHGSRRNVSPSVLDYLIGEIEKNKEKSISAFVSAGKNDSSHPRQVVVNAFIDRGCKVFATQGAKIRHSRGDDVPEREGWTTADPLPYKEVKNHD